MRRCLAVGALLVMVSACSSGATSSDTTPDTRIPVSPLYAPAEGGTLAWKSCSGDSLDPLQWLKVVHLIAIHLDCFVDPLFNFYTN